MVLQGTTYWTDLFVRHFLFQEEQAIDCDDLLFFVRKRHVRGSSRYLPKYEVMPRPCRLPQCTAAADTVIVRANSRPGTLHVLSKP